MNHVFIGIEAVEVLQGFSLKLKFSDGVEKIVDLEPVLYGELLGQLREPKEFQKVFVDEEVGTICWPCGADFDPDTLYRWEQCVEKFSEQMQRLAS